MIYRFVSSAGHLPPRWSAWSLELNEFTLDDRQLWSATAFVYYFRFLPVVFGESGSPLGADVPARRYASRGSFTYLHAERWWPSGPDGTASTKPDDQQTTAMSTEHYFGTASANSSWCGFASSGTLLLASMHLIQQ